MNIRFTIVTLALLVLFTDAGKTPLENMTLHIKYSYNKEIMCRKILICHIKAPL